MGDAKKSKKSLAKRRLKLMALLDKLLIEKRTVLVGLFRDAFPEKERLQMIKNTWQVVGGFTSYFSKARDDEEQALFLEELVITLSLGVFGGYGNELFDLNRKHMKLMGEIISLTETLREHKSDQ